MAAVGYERKTVEKKDFTGVEIAWVNLNYKTFRVQKDKEHSILTLILPLPRFI